MSLEQVIPSKLRAVLNIDSLIDHVCPTFAGCLVDSKDPFHMVWSENRAPEQVSHVGTNSGVKSLVVHPKISKVFTGFVPSHDVYHVYPLHPVYTINYYHIKSLTSLTYHGKHIIMLACKSPEISWHIPMRSSCWLSSHSLQGTSPPWSRPGSLAMATVLYWSRSAHSLSFPKKDAEKQ
jgi:hypothetical protein